MNVINNIIEFTFKRIKFDNLYSIVLYFNDDQSIEFYTQFSNN